MDSIKEKLVQDHLFLADRFAGKFRKKLPKHISFDEIKSAAYMGLVMATRNYGFEHPFSKYASCYIYGAIIDYVRGLDNYRRKNKIKFKSIDVEDFYGNPVAFNVKDESIVFPHTKDFFSNIQKIVSERQFEALQYYYIHNLTLVEIAEKMGIRWSRVQQLIQIAKSKIKKYIHENKNNRFSFAYNLI